MKMSNNKRKTQKNKQKNKQNKQYGAGFTIKNITQNVNNRIKRLGKFAVVKLDENCEIPNTDEYPNVNTLVEPSSELSTGSKSKIDIFTKKDNSAYIMKKQIFPIKKDRILYLINSAKNNTKNNAQNIENIKLKIAKERFLMEYNFYKMMKILVKTNTTPYCIIGSDFDICQSNEDKNYVNYIMINEAELEFNENFETRNLVSFINAYNEDLTQPQFNALLFQIVYTLCVFQRLGIQHNDLHLENILVYFKYNNETNTNNTKPNTYNKFVFNDNKSVLIENYSFEIRIFDFDRSLKKKTNTSIPEIDKEYYTSIDSLSSSASAFEKATNGNLTKMPFKQDIYKVLSSLYIEIYNQMIYSLISDDDGNNIIAKNLKKIKKNFQKMFILYKLIKINEISINYDSLTIDEKFIKLFVTVAKNYDAHFGNRDKHFIDKSFIVKNDENLKNLLNMHFALMYGYYIDYKLNQIKYFVAPFWEKYFNNQHNVMMYNNTNGEKFHLLCSNKTNIVDIKIEYVDDDIELLKSGDKTIVEYRNTLPVPETNYEQISRESSGYSSVLESRLNTPNTPKTPNTPNNTSKLGTYITIAPNKENNSNNIQNTNSNNNSELGTYIMIAPNKENNSNNIHNIQNTEIYLPDDIAEVYNSLEYLTKVIIPLIPMPANITDANISNTYYMP